MSEEIKKEVQDTELDLEELKNVSGGATFGKQDEGSTWGGYNDQSGTIIPCCIYCGKWFGSVDELNEHLKKEHP